MKLKEGNIVQNKDSQVMGVRGTEGEEGDTPRLPSQAETLVRGEDEGEQKAEEAVSTDIDYLQELIQIAGQKKDIAIFGTRNMGYVHQQLVEILAYAIILTGSHIITSGATGTNAAVIRGALRAENQDLLTVVLPQSLDKQPAESQEMLTHVENLIEKPENDHLSLFDASRLCNQDIVSRCQQVICFAFHDSHLLLETCKSAKEDKRIVTLLYLD